jgi:hypothetical protein
MKKYVIFDYKLLNSIPGDNKSVFTTKKVVIRKKNAS